MDHLVSTDPPGYPIGRITWLDAAINAIRPLHNGAFGEDLFGAYAVCFCICVLDQFLTLSLFLGHSGLV